MELKELYHHGIKGMKWGVRRTEAQLARVRGSKVDNSSKNSNDTKVSNSDKTDTKSKDQFREKAKAEAKRMAKKGAIASAKAVNKIGKAYLTDQLFFGGAGTKATKTAIKYTGRAAVTAYTMARGGYDIRWYDN